MREHPDDRKSRIESMREARKRIDAFVRRRPLSMRRLILTYRDDDAQKMLERLREEFWINL